MARVYVTRRIPQAGLDILERDHEVEVWQGDLPPPPDKILRGVADADALVSLLTDRITGDVIAAAPRLRVIANYAVGYENIDVDAATQRGIAVTNTPEVLTETTADLAWTLMLAVARRVVEGVEYAREGRWKTWEPLGLLGPDIWGATLGLVGLGRIGGAVARRSQGFNMRVVYYDPGPRAHPPVEGLEQVDLDRLLRESDFVSLHTPLTPETRGLMNAERLASMKPSAILVNTARGPIVDTDALYEALAAGQLWGAGLDVTDPEPLPPDHPLYTLSNCLILPHIASASIATRDRMATLAAENVIAVLGGHEPPTSVNWAEVRIRSQSR